MTKQNTYWNAEVYERIGKPMREWSRAVIRDLDLKGHETVLDAGCGSGSVTFDLAEQLPHGRIYAVDSSGEMIDKITSEVDERGVTNIIPVLASLTDFELPERVDVVFSNAVFHWISDDDALFGCLLRAAKPGGRLRAQCGGAGNIDAVPAAAREVRKRTPYSGHIGDVRQSTTFRTPGEATAALERNGWSDARANLWDAPIPFESHEEAAVYLRTIVLRDYVEALPEDLIEPFGRDVVSEVDRQTSEPFFVDYVRLDMWASRPE